MIQYNIPEFVNLQMERVLFWYFIIPWLFCLIMFMCRGWTAEIFLNVN